MLFFNKLRAWKRAHRTMAVPFPSSAELAKRQRTSQSPCGIIVAFYTTESFYEQEKDRLVLSAQRLNLPIKATAIECTGSWVTNAGQKAKFLLEQRKNLSGPILYVDVDAVFHNDPWSYLLIDQNSDISAYFEANGSLLSGTLFINDTNGALKLLEEWRDSCELNPDMWDQKVLEDIVIRDKQSSAHAYKFGTLPVSFCWIFDRVENEPTDKVFIEHLQASREANRTARWFGKIGKRLIRRRMRIEQIEAELLS